MIHNMVTRVPYIYMTRMRCVAAPVLKLVTPAAFPLCPILPLPLGGQHTCPSTCHDH